MTREVSRRTSRPPESKAKVSYPDQPGKRDLDPKIVEDRPDPTIWPDPVELLERMTPEERRKLYEQEPIPPETNIARSTGYKDNNNGPEIQRNTMEDYMEEIDRDKPEFRGVGMDAYFNKLGPVVDEKPKRRK